MYRRPAAILFAIIVSAAPFGPSAGAETEPHIPLLLETGWGRSTAALDAARQIYDRAEASSELDYAMALVMCRHRRYESAKKLLAASVAKDKSNLRAWRALFWLDTYTRKYDAALDHMQALAALFPKNKARAEFTGELRESARYMGQLIGYLEGPRNDSVGAAALLKCNQVIDEKLNDEWQSHFDDGKQQVLYLFEPLSAKLDEERKQNVAREEEAKARELDIIAQERIGIAQTLQSLRGLAETAKAEADAQVYEIDRAMEPISRRGRDLQREAEPIARRISDLRRQIAQAEEDERRAGDDDARRDEARRRADSLRRDLQRESGRLAPIEALLRDIRNQINRLQAQRNSVVARYQSTRRRLAAQQSKLLRTEKDLDKQQRIVTNRVAAPTEAIKEGEKRLAAISTYCPFSLETERRVLLNSLRK